MKLVKYFMITLILATMTSCGILRLSKEQDSRTEQSDNRKSSRQEQSRR